MISVKNHHIPATIRVDTALEHTPENHLSIETFKFGYIVQESFGREKQVRKKKAWLDSWCLNVPERICI